MNHRTLNQQFLPFILAPLLLLGAFARADQVSFPLEIAATGTYYIQAILDEHVDTMLLLDTGSGYVSLSQQTFNKLAAGSTKRLLRHIQGVMANGKKVTVPIYQIAELRLGSSCVLHEIEVAVMPAGSRDILGLNAIRQLQPVTLALDPPSLSGNCENAI